MHRTKLVLCAALIGLLASACSQEPPPLTASSGEQPSYAEHYPARLTTLRTGFASDEAKVQAALPELQPAADKLNSADPATLAELFKLADTTGKSSAYASSALEAETIASFWEEEKQPLHQKIGGAVAYAGGQKECSKECSDHLGGVAAGASDRAVEKQLEERAQRLGELHRFVEDHEEQLGKPNLENAEKQASAIALLSHIVHVRLELYHRELQASLSDASDVKSTLERIEKESDAVLADPKASKNKRALAEKRKADASAARTSLTAELDLAQGALDQMEQRNKKVADDYDKDFEALIDSLEQKAKAKK
ncbi:MAG TPA: hypothetical protein VJN18_10370 [Polyangiaceae bacterium]|nr:hypothetical protein [Polyangiaceae bacterium]